MSDFVSKLLDVYVSEKLNLESVLAALSQDGFAPALVFDDDGRWALTFNGSSPVVMDDVPIEMVVTSFVSADQWKPTVKEAVLYALEQSTDEGGGE